MKRLFIFCFLILCCTQSVNEIVQPVDLETLIEKDGFKYGPDGDKKFTGPVFKLHENGNKEMEGAYKNGEIFGRWTTWYENGQKRKQMEYDGFIKRTRIPSPKGLLTEWYENGQKAQEGKVVVVVVNDFGKIVRDSIWTKWYENGETASVLDLISVPGFSQSSKWYENGQKMESGLFDGSKKEGDWTYWDENGQMVKTEHYAEGELVETTEN